MKICLIQVDSADGTPNLEFAVRTINEQKADLYVLPELFTVGLKRARTDPQEYAQPLNGTVVRDIQRVLKLRTTAAVVAGLLEGNSGAFYNAAAVIQPRRADTYRQIYPASAGASSQRFTRGSSKTVIGCEWSTFRSKIGLMVCHDYNAAEEEFFPYYKEQRTDAIVMIAESEDGKWRKTFPVLCENHRIPSIVCNSAGTRMGGSCGWDAAGVPLLIQVQGAGVRQQLPEDPAIGITALTL
jgi:predicted amidohydrolase